jgi:hypothetical protein
MGTKAKSSACASPAALLSLWLLFLPHSDNSFDSHEGPGFAIAGGHSAASEKERMGEASAPVSWLFNLLRARLIAASLSPTQVDHVGVMPADQAGPSTSRCQISSIPFIRPVFDCYRDIRASEVPRSAANDTIPTVKLQPGRLR